MSALEIPFPDEAARDLLLNGYYRPQLQGARRVPALEKLREDADSKAAEYKKYHDCLASLRAVKIPPRCIWYLADAGAASLADVARLGPGGLEKARNIGSKSIRELKALLLNSGLALGDSWGEWEARQEAREG
jgi:DNA-directed RNA polymerase alpha subunit